MNPLTEFLTIRPAHNDDIDGMRTLLSEITRVGGTTATTNELARRNVRVVRLR